MKRKIYNQLLTWKEKEAGKVAILVDGARRIGKSYIVEEFARNEYKSYILVDFSHISKTLKEVFENYLTENDTFFMYLQTVTGVTLYPRESVIIFDEVQFYPQARAAIKHLVADGRYDYIETGSLVSIHRNVKNILIPSEERHLQMYPMDFEEFLWALGDETTMPFIRHCFDNKKPLGPMHRKAMDLFRQYMIVGGMPQAVKLFADRHNFLEVDTIKRDILNLYQNDIQKYALGYESKVSKIYAQLPGQLQKHEKKFRLASLRDNARFRDYESSFFWLNEAQVTNMCRRATEPTIGLKMREDDMTFKLYLNDTGLLVSMAFSEQQIVSQELYQKLLLGKLEVNEGMFVENVVAQLLRCGGHALYFFSSYSSTEADERMEIDFLIQKSNITNRHNICPIEVKSGSRYATASLRKFCKKYYEQVSTPIVLHSGDVKIDDDIHYFPLYMVGCL